VEENLRLKKELIKYQKDNSNLAYCLSDVEGIDKGLDEFLKKWIASKKKMLNWFRNKNSWKKNRAIKSSNKLIKEKNGYMTNNKILSGQIKEERKRENKIRKSYRRANVYFRTKQYPNWQIIKNKEILIEDLTQKLNEYMGKISIKDKKVNELMISLE